MCTHKKDVERLSYGFEGCFFFHLFSFFSSAFLSCCFAVQKYEMYVGNSPFADWVS